MSFSFEMRPLKHLTHYLQGLIEKRLWLQVLIGMAAGIAAGIILSPATGWVDESITSPLRGWLELPGTLFLKMVQMIMIPLIFASIITGISANENFAQLRTFGIRLLIYFLATTTISIVLGLSLATIFTPGEGMNLPAPLGEMTGSGSGDALPELSDIPQKITHLLPENPLASMVTGEMLSIVIFTIIIGVAMNALPKASGDPILKLLNSVQEVCMTIVKWAMKLVPFAVFGLMANLISGIGIDSLVSISMYIGVVLAGLLVLLLIYLTIAGFLGGVGPARFLAAIRDVQLLAFSTTSSAAVMPLSIKTAEEKLGVKPVVSRFLIPIGATINMDGTALYQCVSTIFIAQAYGIELSLSSLILIVFTIVAASVGTPAIPGGGIIIMATILQSAGIPPSGMMIIIGVERILGMFRTAINVTGDLTACTVFNRWINHSESRKVPVET